MTSPVFVGRWAHSSVGAHLDAFRAALGFGAVQIYEDLARKRRADRACAMTVLAAHRQPADHVPRMPTPEEAARMYGRGSVVHRWVMDLSKMPAPRLDVFNVARAS